MDTGGDGQFTPRATRRRFFIAQPTGGKADLGLVNVEASSKIVSQPEMGIITSEFASAADGEGVLRRIIAKKIDMALLVVPLGDDKRGKLRALDVLKKTQGAILADISIALFTQRAEMGGSGSQRIRDQIEQATNAFPNSAISIFDEIITSRRADAEAILRPDFRSPLETQTARQRDAIYGEFYRPQIEAEARVQAVRKTYFRAGALGAAMLALVASAQPLTQRFGHLVGLGESKVALQSPSRDPLPTAQRVSLSEVEVVRAAPLAALPQVVREGRYTPPAESEYQQRFIFLRGRQMLEVRARGLYTIDGVLVERFTPGMTRDEYISDIQRRQPIRNIGATDRA